MLVRYNLRFPKTFIHNESHGGAWVAIRGVGNVAIQRNKPVGGVFAIIYLRMFRSCRRKMQTNVDLVTAERNCISYPFGSGILSMPPQWRISFAVLGRFTLSTLPCQNQGRGPLRHGRQEAIKHFKCRGNIALSILEKRWNRRLGRLI